MADSPNFASVLDRKSSEVAAPQPLPVGTYLWLVDGQPRFDKSSKKQTEFVEFTLRCLQPMEDVDQEQLNAMGGCAGKQMKATFYLTDTALPMLTNDKGTGFLDLLADFGDISIRQQVATAPGNQILGSIRHRPSDDGQRLYAEFARWAKV